MENTKTSKASFQEFIEELINIIEHPEDSNEGWKNAIIENAKEKIKIKEISKNNKMEKTELLHKLTGTENPKFITERENVIIDKCLTIINGSEVTETVKPAVKKEYTKMFMPFNGVSKCAAQIHSNHYSCSLEHILEMINELRKDFTFETKDVQVQKYGGNRIKGVTFVEVFLPNDTEMPNGYEEMETTEYVL